MCRKKKKVQIRKFEVAFISLCTKGEDGEWRTKQNGKRPLDELYDRAVEAGLESEIINAVDDDGDKPLHIAAEFGNSEVVQWILDKPELKADVNSKNGNDLTPLFLVCLKGYVGAEGIGSKTDSVK